MNIIRFNYNRKNEDLSVEFEGGTIYHHVIRRDSPAGLVLVQAAKLALQEVKKSPKEYPARQTRKAKPRSASWPTEEQVEQMRRNPPVKVVPAVTARNDVARSEGLVSVVGAGVAFPDLPQECKFRETCSQMGSFCVCGKHPSELKG